MESYRHYLTQLKGVLDQLPLEQLREVGDLIYHAYEKDHTVFVFGNGGSAALASHLATDFAKGTHYPSPAGCDLSGVRRMKVMSLTDNVSMITAWSNDLAYDAVFAEQMENFVQPGDVVIGISGSGNSPNVLRALELARKKGATTVGLTGFAVGKMKALLEYALVVPSDSMQQIEDAHVVMAHMLFLDLKERISHAGRSRA